MDLSAIRRWLDAEGITHRYAYILVGSMALFVLAVLLAVNDTPSDVEVTVFRWFNRLPADWAGALQVISNTASFPSALILWAAIAYAIGRYQLLIQLIIASTSSWALAAIFKQLIGRNRPGELLAHVQQHGHQLDSLGFPSGHAAIIAACVTVLILRTKSKYGPYLIGAALLVGVSRMYLGVHFPLDVVGGWALGTLVAVTTIILLRRL
jgi:membrane-associated phospholipid phosphatase